MKNLSLPLLFSLTLLTSGLINGQTNNLLPSPKKATWGDDKFRLEGARIVVSADLLEREQTAISQFTLFIKENTGISIYTTYSEDPGKQMIILKSHFTNS